MDATLASYATVRELEYLEAVEKHGVVGAARHFKVHHGVVSRAIARLKMRAAAKGYAPSHDMRHTVPEGFKVKGVSTYYDEEGKPRGQWVKSSADEERREQMMREFAATLAESVHGLAPVSQPPAVISNDLLCVYPWGDPHFGMYAWWQDAGEDFDLDIAERLTCGAVDRLVSAAPMGSTGLLLNLGDMFHADNQRNMTNSGHQLDVDGRWSKVQQVGLRAMIHCIRRMLEKHSRVIVRINKGNHDGHSSYALALMLSCYFHNDKRVQVDLSPAPCWYMLFGNVLIGSTHGDTIKGKDMGAVMAADVPKDWGASTHRYWYVGHVHHKDVKEYPGCIVEYVRTLAARDAWHQGQGYRAGRDMALIVHHREHGEIERHRCDVGML
jgi:hypothetical protein